MTDDVTHGEILKIKKEIIDIKQAQEIDMQRNREKYTKYVSEILSTESRAKVFLEVDGLKSRKEIENHIPFSQPTVWRAIKYYSLDFFLCSIMSFTSLSWAILFSMPMVQLAWCKKILRGRGNSVPGCQCFPVRMPPQ